MHKENEIHRDYEIEEFVFDDCIKEQVKELLGRYRSDFRANKDSNLGVRDLTMEFGGIPLFENLKYFYNNDVCISCATCILKYFVAELSYEKRQRRARNQTISCPCFNIYGELTERHR